MNELNEIDKTQKSIRIKEQTYNRLSEDAKSKETFNEVIEMLLNFYDANNTDLHSSSLELLKESVDFPLDDEHKKIALQFFEGILDLGKDLSFLLQKDTKERVLIKNRKNKIKFYKGKKALCLIRTGREKVWIYLPTDKQETELPGWEWEGNIYDEDM
jgi:predicted CopG family antitoxin